MSWIIQIPIVFLQSIPAHTHTDAIHKYNQELHNFIGKYCLKEENEEKEGICQLEFVSAAYHQYVRMGKKHPIFNPFYSG